MKTRMSGFTLLELMMVLVIVGVLMGFAVPSMRGFFLNARMTGAANDLMAALHMARSEAIKRRMAVTVCASANPLDEPPNVPTCSASTNFTGMGWIVFVDPNRDGQVDITSFNDTNGNGVWDPAEVDANGDGVLDASEDLNGNGVLDPAETVTGVEEVLQRHAALASGIAGAAADRTAGAAVPLRVTYLDTGTAAGGDPVAVVLCDSRGNVPASGALSAARGISISATGRAGVSREVDQIASLIADVGTVGGCTN